ncbi:uncharacterized protein BJ212DRAFT_1485744 [Suillus subaureus]|uniref:Uncharacterized protein n=1 Tax=Suillus subaureus TaxID=48587 RepID=A0A9P7J7R6_9AGAM|nr:uncharacterized protein BJ212DRAFT_1485744 [Suillus subaureus]KAG1807350.1 hypothetical protein BJ212DRAFT_1485744 [Suillus subaureus]
MKQIVHPGPTDEVALPDHKSPLANDVAMDLADEGYYTLGKLESDEGTDGGATEHKDNDNELSHGLCSSNETLPNAQHLSSNNTSPATNLPTTSIHGAVHARVHILLEVTSTHGNTFSLTHSFKGDTLLNVNHSTPESKAKIDQTDNERFEADSDLNADQSDKDQSDADDDGKLMTSMDLDSPPNLTELLAHIIGMFRGDLRDFEVDPLPLGSKTDALREVKAFITERGLHAKETTYHCPLNQRPRGPLLAQTNWEHCIKNIDLKSLRQTVSNPDGKPDFLYLIEVMQQYYQNITANLGHLLALTLRTLLSTSPSDPTLEKYGAFLAKFIIFLIRHLYRPIENFDIPLHLQHSTDLTTLHAHLRTTISKFSPAIDLLSINLVHKVIFSLLTHVSSEFLKNEMKDLFTLFLITYHLSDNFGNTNCVCQVPPTISKAQWCFRAMAGMEIYMKMGQFNNNSFEYVFTVSVMNLDRLSFQ